MDNQPKLSCGVCNKPAFSIYKHSNEPVYFCSMGCAGKYRNTNKHAATGCMQMNFNSSPNNLY